MIIKNCKADLHNHLRTSDNFKDEDFNKAIDICNKKLGNYKNYSAFGMINFNDSRYETFSGLKGYDRQTIGNALYIPEKKVVVIKGQEVPTKDGHLLVLGLKENVHLKSNQTLEDTIKEAKDNNGILIADHPFYSQGLGKRLNDANIRDSIDGIEIFNGEATNAMNREAIIFYHKSMGYMDYSAISSSDGHSFYELGNNFITLPDLDITDSEKLVESLKFEISRSELYPSRKKHSIIGTLDHFADLAVLIAKSKFGIQ